MFSEMDIDGKGTVMFSEWCQYLQREERKFNTPLAVLLDAGNDQQKKSKVDDQPTAMDEQESNKRQADETHEEIESRKVARMEERKGEKRQFPHEEEDSRKKRVNIGNVMYEMVVEEDDEAVKFGEIQDEEYFDSRDGRRLHPEEVREARAEEMSFVENIKVYEETDLSECFEKTGKPPISTKWVDVNKAMNENEL